nr:MAG TPA: hypothetical protein [Caudoviricetes sp.]DAK65400.1 MAG TPA: hypothetical protein [Caudoviricetes sp.]DAQ80450.1 MAG TPA: hypothetical protein [Herelleviridae sp.]
MAHSLLYSKTLCRRTDRQVLGKYDVSNITGVTSK